MNREVTAPLRILCFGDSNTYGFDPRSYFGGRYDAENRWTDLLAARSGWEVLCAGENGREIPAGERAFRQFGALLSCEKPDILVVMLGSNDLLQGADVPQTAARMERFLRQAAFAKDCTMLVAPPAMQPGAWVTEPRLLMDSAALAEAYRKLSADLEIRFADAGAWEIPMTFDGVHFTEEGHRRFACGLYPHLAALFGERR